ncbi:MAG TPA: M56 family metallopeptidase [Pirellulales bacterium]
MTLDFTWLGQLAWSQLWQVTVLIGVAAVVTRLCCRSRPHLAHLLWLVVLVKCWIPPVWSSPTGVFSWAQSSRSSGGELPTSPRRQRAARPVLVNDAAPVHFVETRPPSLAAMPIQPSIDDDGNSFGHSPESRFAWYLFGIWLGGTAFVATLTILRGGQWRRRATAGARPTPAHVTSLLSEVAQSLGLRRPPHTFVTSLPVGPAAFGLWRPTIVLPEFLICGGAREQLRAVLAHELVHVRRGDVAVGFFQWLTQAVWWFHPLVWWAGRELARQRECSCDEEVVAALRCEGAQYAQSLLDVLKVRRRLRGAPAWVGMRPVDITRRRLAHIVERGAAARERTPWPYWLLAALALLAVAPGAELRLRALAVADDESQESATVESSEAAESKPADRSPAAAPPKDDPPADDDNGDPEAPDRRQPTEDTARIRRAIDRGVAYLKAQQNDDGSWKDPPGFVGGITAICTLALLESGAVPADDAVQRALAYLRTLKPQTTYAASLATMVFCAAEPQRDQKHIQRYAKWLAEQQKQVIPMRGAWGYPQAEGDNSNTGFAVLALYEADRAGVQVEQDVWRRTLKYWTSTQAADGAWGYKPFTPGTGSMTCQGIACVAAACEVLDERQPDQPGPIALQKASQWLGQHFSVEINPGITGRNAQGWRLYYLRALSRAGRLSGRREFGNHDWFAEGAKSLLALQTIPGGYWKGAGHAEDEPQFATSLALLFLAHQNDLAE